MNIIYEDKQILILDKPSGLVVNRSETIRQETLQDQLSYYFNLGEKLGIGDRAGIVHRLDRETSGLMIVAKTTKSFEKLQDQFKTRKVIKKYIALVHGLVGVDSGTIEAKIKRIGSFGKFGVVEMRYGGRPYLAGAAEGKEAKTDFEVSKRYKFNEEKFVENVGTMNLTKSRVNYLRQNANLYTLINLFPRTGRTHQIRVHIKSIGHPPVSDQIYTPSKLLKFDLSWCGRLFLHASEIEFTHPAKAKLVKFSSSLPNDLKNAILNLRQV